MSSLVQNFKFNDVEEDQIARIEKSVKEKADYNLRQVLSIFNRIQEKVSTGKKNEFGDDIEDWNKITTKDLISYFTEANAWNFYATPVRLQGFIESSLAEIVYKSEYNQVLIDPTLSGTVAAKAATAELDTQDSNFVFTYRKLYTAYVTDVLKSFDLFLKRLEKIIDWRIQEEKYNPNKNPF